MYGRVPVLGFAKAQDDPWDVQAFLLCSGAWVTKASIYIPNIVSAKELKK